MQIKPFINVGPIFFGMTRAEVAKLSLGPMRSFKQSTSSSMLSDQFLELNLIVSYKDAGIVEYIEFYKGGNPTFDEVNLLQISPNHLKSLLMQYDKDLEILDSDVLAHNIGIGAHIRDADEEENEPAETQSVIVFEKGYYD